MPGLSVLLIGNEALGATELLAENRCGVVVRFLRPAKCIDPEARKERAPQDDSQVRMTVQLG
jgi:hypothetical protein